MTNSWLNQKQCKTIQSDIMKAILPKMHLNRCFPHEIVFGSAKYGGINFPRQYQEQVFLSIQKLIGRIRKKDEVSEMIIISLKWAQLDCGKQETILRKIDSFPQYCDEQSWVIQLWKFLHQFDMSIVVNNIQIQQKQRQNDTHIMNHMIHLPKMKAY